MKTIRNYMKWNEKTIYIIFAALFFIAFSRNIYNSAKSYKLRGLCNQYREQLIAAEETNRELTDRFGRITEITERIGKTTERNVTDARGIIETVEELRTEIKELEDCCCSFDLSDYYNYYDSYYRNEGLMD